jgi:WD40 repeat protein
MLASLKEHKSSVHSIKLTKDDTELVSASADGSCIVWSLRPGGQVHRQNAFFDTTMFKSVLYHPDESQILTCGSDRKITYWDASDVNAIRVIEGALEAELNALDIEPDGVLFVCGGNDKLVKVWHYNDGVCKAQGMGHSGGISALKISPNQKSIVSVGAEGAIFMWKMPAEGAVDLAAQGIKAHADVKDEIETVRDDEGNTQRTAGGHKQYRSLK